MPVGDRFVGQRPLALGRLQLGRVGRKKLQHDALRHDEPVTDVPTGLIQNQDDQLVLAGADRLGKRGQHRAEQVGVDRGADEPDHRPGARVDEAVEVEPGVAVLADRDRALALGRPSPTQDRLQADAMLVERPDLDRPLEVPSAMLLHPAREPLLKASCSAALAALAWRGRGTWEL